MVEPELQCRNMTPNSIENIVTELRKGKMDAPLDDEDLEQRGSLFQAATIVQPDDINLSKRAPDLLAGPTDQVRRNIRLDLEVVDSIKGEYPLRSPVVAAQPEN